MTTPQLGLATLSGGQAQKHLTVNEALQALDAFAQLAVIDRDLTAPPGAPSDGDRYLIAASATDAWAGHDGKLAIWIGGAWTLFEPRPGWVCFVEDETALLLWDGAAWRTITIT